MERRITLKHLPQPPPTSNPELDSLFVAAMVSQDFRQKLLCNAVQALADGYSNQRFKLNPIERALVLSIRAETIEDFAQQLHQRRDELLGATLPQVRQIQHKEDTLGISTSISLLQSSFDFTLDLAA